MPGLLNTNAAFKRNLEKIETVKKDPFSSLEGKNTGLTYEQLESIKNPTGTLNLIARDGQQFLLLKKGQNPYGNSLYELASHVVLSGGDFRIMDGNEMRPDKYNLIMEDVRNLNYIAPQFNNIPKPTEELVIKSNICPLSIDNNRAIMNYQSSFNVHTFTGKEEQVHVRVSIAAAPDLVDAPLFNIGAPSRRAVTIQQFDENGAAKTLPAGGAIAAVPIGHIERQDNGTYVFRPVVVDPNAPQTSINLQLGNQASLLLPLKFNNAFTFFDGQTESIACASQGGGISEDFEFKNDRILSGNGCYPFGSQAKIITVTVNDPYSFSKNFFQYPTVLQSEVKRCKNIAVSSNMKPSEDSLRNMEVILKTKEFCDGFGMFSRQEQMIRNSIKEVTDRVS